MIPDGTSPEAIVLTLVGVSFVFCLLMAGYFWYRSPESFAWIVRIMSRLPTERTAPATSSPPSSTSTNHATLADTYQAEPSAPPVIEPSANLHNMSRSALIALLSVQKTETGAYRWTANQIAAFVGGTRAEVLKEIAGYRPAPAAPAQIKRPVNGWQA